MLDLSFGFSGPDVQTTFESLDINKLGSNYDCISMWNVLEHIYDLNYIVSVIKKLSPLSLLLRKLL